MKKRRVKLWDIFFPVIAITFLIFVVVNILKSDRNSVCFEKSCFEVELAVIEEEQVKGLTGREFLGQNKGMLYVFDKEDFYNFWMKNMSFPLDIIWINNNFVVVDIMENADPCKGPICFDIVTDKKAKYVLEVNSETVKNIDLKVGDKTEIVFMEKIDDESY